MDRRTKYAALAIAICSLSAPAAVIAADKTPSPSVTNWGTPIVDKTPSPRVTNWGIPTSTQSAKRRVALIPVPASISGVPATVTSVKDAAQGAMFVAYKVSTSAVALPATQPTRGGEPLKIGNGDGKRAALALANGKLSGALQLKVLAGKATTFAIYPSNNGTPILVAVSSTGALTMSGTLSAAWARNPSLTLKPHPTDTLNATSSSNPSSTPTPEPTSTTSTSAGSPTNPKPSPSAVP